MHRPRSYRGAQRFERAGQQIDVVWSPDGGAAEVWTLSGGKSTVAATGGQLALKAGADPAYLVHAPVGGADPFSGMGQRFAETGKMVRGPFLDYWRAHGGLAINGFPVSDEMTQLLEDGRPYTVQYFERVRLEWHPGNPEPYRVLLGQFGRQEFARLNPAP